MADSIGDMAWLNLTVSNAEQVKDFYADVSAGKRKVVAWVIMKTLP